MSEPEIARLREEIDQLDRRIVAFLSQRAARAVEIGRLKRESDQPVLDADRERDLLVGLSRLNTGPLPDSALDAIFSEVIAACRQLQEPTRIAFLGPEATFSHAAALKNFGRSAAYLPRGSIADVFSEVERGRAEFGVVPAENSTEGAIGLTLDLLTGSKLKICGEIYLPIAHALMARGAELDRIRTVLSHPQALAQCRGWLARNLPAAVLVETASTAAAARRAIEEPDAAVVGSKMLAELHRLNVLAEAIQDRPLNLTRFLVLGRNSQPATGRDKTSLSFVAPHRPGALARCLTPFAVFKINLTRIESRPAPNRPWEYVFFLDFEGHLDDPEVKAALKNLAAEAEEVKILGSYPRGEQVDPAARTDGAARPAKVRLVADTGGR